jgi:hypothetical protein
MKEQENAFTESCRCVDRSRRGVVPDQPVHPDGLQHQNHSEHRGGCVRLRLGIAGHGIVGERKQFPASAMT